jgi:phage shock protein A
MAIDEMIDSGTLVDYSNNEDQIDLELEKSEIKNKVEYDLAKLKSSLAP